MYWWLKYIAYLKESKILCSFVGKKAGKVGCRGTTRKARVEPCNVHIMQL